MPHFHIQDTAFDTPLSVGSAGLTVQSSPRPYRVDFLSSQPLGATINRAIAEAAHPIVLADRRVVETHLSSCAALAKAPALIAEATEDFKTLDGVMRLVALLKEHNATRSSMLFAIGGGIIQDVAAFACSMYKRGIPWTFAPSTLLAQGDSCLGGKTGLNHFNTKNLLGLFSAPRRVIIHTGFLATLEREDLLSGLGEVFRLCVTGGGEFVDLMERLLPAALAAEPEALTRLIEASLSVKRAVVERDEFEIDLRRSMNLGHSVGHAFEAISRHGIPHGIGVTVGILVENEISFRRGLLSEADRQRLLALGSQLIPPRSRAALAGLRLGDILNVLRSDKKTEGSTLKLVVLERIGTIRFIDLVLDDGAVAVLEAALARVLEALNGQYRSAA